MAIEVIRGVTHKPAAMEQLVGALSADSSLEGTLWVGFPLLNDAESTFAVDALYLSDRHGIIVFDVVEGTSLGEFDRRQDDLIRLVQSKLLREKNLARRGKLLIPVESCSFAPAVSPQDIDQAKSENQDYALARSTNGINDNLLLNVNLSLSSEVVEHAKSSLQNLSTLRKTRTRRQLVEDNSRGARLLRLENSIATLDKSQSEAVLQVPNGVQRIRGLAGSGKTVVLALKAAYLHAANPEWKIAVTFNVRSLKQQFKTLIQEFHVGETGTLPDWSKVQVINSWGSPLPKNGTGVYAEFCKVNGVEYQDFRSASNLFGGQTAFDEVCKAALSNVSKSVPVFDCILVDEAQDFSPSFLRICYELLDENKRLVYAYDELQNLSTNGMPSPEEIFGRKEDGSPVVRFDRPDASGSRRDILLEKCYRNSRPVLSTAHAFGFGIYRETPANLTTGLVQMFDQPSLWEDIGYRVTNGVLESNAVVTLSRTESSSPRFLEQHSSTDDLISVQSFRTMEEQYAWIAESIRHNLTVDELSPDDIMIINPDPISARKNFGLLRNMLLDMGINTHIAGVDTSTDTFFSNDSNSITCTGIYRAKGNESGMVYVINAHEGQANSYNLSTNRNRLFTAITRSKAWVRLTGISPHMDNLLEEFKRIKELDFALNFRYPTAAEREKLRIVHRELTANQQEVVSASDRFTRDLLRRLQAGSLHAQDLDSDVRRQLLDILGSEDEQF